MNVLWPVTVEDKAMKESEIMLLGLIDQEEVITTVILVRMPIFSPCCVVKVLSISAEALINYIALAKRAAYEDDICV